MTSLTSVWLMSGTSTIPETTALDLYLVWRGVHTLRNNGYYVMRDSGPRHVLGVL